MQWTSHRGLASGGILPFSPARGNGGGIGLSQDLQTSFTQETHMVDNLDAVVERFLVI